VNKCAIGTPQLIQSLDLSGKGPPKVDTVGLDATGPTSVTNLPEQSKHTSSTNDNSNNNNETKGSRYNRTTGSSDVENLLESIKVAGPNKQSSSEIPHSCDPATPETARNAKQYKRPLLTSAPADSPNSPNYSHSPISTLISPSTLQKEYPTFSPVNPKNIPNFVQTKVSTSAFKLPSRSTIDDNTRCSKQTSKISDTESTVSSDVYNFTLDVYNKRSASPGPPKLASPGGRHQVQPMNPYFKLLLRNGDKSKTCILNSLYLPNYYPHQNTANYRYNHPEQRGRFATWDEIKLPRHYFNNSDSESFEIQIWDKGRKGDDQSTLIGKVKLSVQKLLENKVMTGVQLHHPHATSASTESLLENTSTFINLYLNHE